MRKQKGYLYKASGVWYVRHYDNQLDQTGAVVRKQVSTRIGLVKDFPAKEMARREAERVLRPINEGTYTPESTQTLGEFAEKAYFPNAEKQLRPSTYRGYLARWRQIQKYGRKQKPLELILRETRTVHLQQLLEEIARSSNLNKESIAHLKTLLSAIFGHAIRLGIIDGPNPVENTKLPKAREKGETRAYELETILQMLSVLSEPAATIIAMAAFTGARRGELRGTLWENYDGKQINITQSVWEQFTTDPKNRKSKAPIPIISPLAKMLDRHRLASGDPKTGPIFVSERGTPLNLNNIARRLIRPALKKAGIPWYGFHAFRRGLATVLHDLGIDDHSIQLILRHGSIVVTQNSYIKALPRQATAAMQKLEETLNLATGAASVQ
jgi:integrase